MPISTDYSNRLTSFAGYGQPGDPDTQKQSNNPTVADHKQPVDQTVTSVKENHLNRANNPLDSVRGKVGEKNISYLVQSPSPHFEKLRELLNMPKREEKEEGKGKRDEESLQQDAFSSNSEQDGERREGAKREQNATTNAPTTAPATTSQTQPTPILLNIPDTSPQTRNQRNSIARPTTLSTSEFIKQLPLLHIDVDLSKHATAEDAYFSALMGSAHSSGSLLDEWIISEIFSPQYLSERKAGQLAASLESLPEKLGFNNTFALALYGYKLTTTLQDECQDASQRVNLKRAESLFTTKLCELSYDPRYKNVNLPTLQFKPEQVTSTFISELKERQLQAQRWASYTRSALLTLGALGTALSIAGLIYHFNKDETPPVPLKKPNQWDIPYYEDLQKYLQERAKEISSATTATIATTAIGSIVSLAAICLGIYKCYREDDVRPTPHVRPTTLSRVGRPALSRRKERSDQASTLDPAHKSVSGPKPSSSSQTQAPLLQTQVDSAGPPNPAHGLGTGPQPSSALSNMRQETPANPEPAQDLAALDDVHVPDSEQPTIFLLDEIKLADINQTLEPEVLETIIQEHLELVNSVIEKNQENALNEYVSKTYQSFKGKEIYPQLIGLKRLLDDEDSIKNEIDLLTIFDLFSKGEIPVIEETHEPVEDGESAKASTATTPTTNSQVPISTSDPLNPTILPAISSAAGAKGQKRLIKAAINKFEKLRTSMNNSLGLFKIGTKSKTNLIPSTSEALAEPQPTLLAALGLSKQKKDQPEIITPRLPPRRGRLLTYEKQDRSATKGNPLKSYSPTSTTTTASTSSTTITTSTTPQPLQSITTISTPPISTTSHVIGTTTSVTTTTHPSSVPHAPQIEEPKQVKVLREDWQTELENLEEVEQFNQFFDPVIRLLKIIEENPSTFRNSLEDNADYKRISAHALKINAAAAPELFVGDNKISAAFSDSKKKTSKEGLLTEARKIYRGAVKSIYNLYTSPFTTKGVEGVDPAESLKKKVIKVKNEIIKLKKKIFPELQTADNKLPDSPQQTDDPPQTPISAYEAMMTTTPQNALTSSSKEEEFLMSTQTITNALQS